MISTLTYALTQVVNITSSRISEAAAQAGTNSIEVVNTEAAPVKTEMVGTQGNFNMLQWLQAIHGAVDTLELNVDNIENISLNTCLLYTSPSPRDQRGSGFGAWWG